MSGYYSSYLGWFEPNLKPPIDRLLSENLKLWIHFATKITPKRTHIYMIIYIYVYYIYIYNIYVYVTYIEIEIMMSVVMVDMDF